MITALIVSQVLTWIVLGLTVVTCIAMARQLGVLYERVAPVGALTSGSGPTVGTLAPQITLRDLDGALVQVGGSAPADTHRLLMFISPHCAICKKLIPIALNFARRENLSVTFAGDDEEQDQQMMRQAQGIERFPFINSGELGRLYGVDKLPHAVLLDSDGTIVAKGLVNSREHLESLINARDMGLASVQEYLATRHQHQHQSADAHS
ncbi:MAG: methylamine utilization protein MauD [Rhizobium sp.]|nr:MAG: methylamine utilization protein MauD [Rhizobium sp.]